MGGRGDLSVSANSPITFLVTNQEVLPPAEGSDS
jgi:hypothetical protein